MIKTRGKQTMVALMGMALSAAVLGGTAEERTVTQPDRLVDRVEQDDTRGGSVLRGDRVLTADSGYFLKVRDRGNRSNRGRGSHGGRDRGSRGHGSSYRHHNRHRGSRHGGYRYSRPYRRHRHGYSDVEPLLWFGLGVLTPYLLDDRFY